VFVLSDLPRLGWRLARLIYIGLLNKAGIHAAWTPGDPLFARPLVPPSPQIPALMTGSPTMEQNLNDVITQAGGISSRKDAQEFADVVSGVYQSPLIMSSITSDCIALPSRCWMLIRS